MRRQVREAVFSDHDGIAPAKSLEARASVLAGLHSEQDALTPRRHRPNPASPSEATRNTCVAEWWRQSSSNRRAAPHRSQGRSSRTSELAPRRSSNTDLRRPRSRFPPARAASDARGRLTAVELCDLAAECFGALFITGLADRSRVVQRGRLRARLGGERHKPGRRRLQGYSESPGTVS